MSDISKNKYFSQGITEEKQSSDVYETVYRMNESKVLVRELELDAGLCGEPLSVGMITDMHIRKERDDILGAVKAAMECVSIADVAVLCGDNIESISDREHVRIFEDEVWKLYPETICVVGNHDQFYGDAAENRKFLDSIWPHDPYCYSRIIDGRLFLLAIDDNTGAFCDGMSERVKKELDKARQGGYPVLLFMHIAFPGLNMEIEENNKVYDVVRGYADIIKASFSGHNHVDWFGEFPGYYTDTDGNTVEKSIPIYKLQANSEPDFTGNVLFVKVK